MLISRCAPLLLLPLAAACGHHHGGHPGSHDGEGYHHKGGHHRFDDADHWATRFEDPERDTWQQPDRVIADLALRPTDVVADIGSATGYFPVRIAKALPQGTVWGVDIEADMVRYLNERANKEGLANLRSVLGDVTDPKIPEAADVVLVVNTYHHIEDRHVYLATLREYLAAGGRVVIVDFKMGDWPVGPPDAMKITPDAVVAEFEFAGYNLRRRDDGLAYQYVLEFGSDDEPVAPQPTDPRAHCREIEASSKLPNGNCPPCPCACNAQGEVVCAPCIPCTPDEAEVVSPATSGATE